MASSLELRLAIVELHQAGKLPIEVTAEDHVELLTQIGVQANARRIGRALIALRFEVVSQKRQRKCRCRTSQCDWPLEQRCRAPRKRSDGKARKSHMVVVRPRVWRRPLAWSPEVHAQLRLSRSHALKSNQVARASDVAFHNGELLNKAIDHALTSRDAPLDHRGILKAAIKEVVDDLWEDAIPRRELAEWLGEDPTVMNRAGLESRTRGLVRLATSRE